MSVKIGAGKGQAEKPALSANTEKKDDVTTKAVKKRTKKTEE